MGKAALLLVFGASVVFTVMNLQLNKAAEQANQNLVGYFERSMAGEIGNQAMEYLLSELADSSTWRVNNWALLPAGVVAMEGEHTVYYRIRDLTKVVRGSEKELIELTVDVKYGRAVDTISVFTGREFGFIPATIRGAFTAVGPLDQTISDMQIDGRHHSLNGTLDPSESGVFGISSGIDFENTQNAVIGGTDAAGKDHPMRFPEDPEIVEENYKWNGTFPESPDEVVGFPDGTLKSLAQSGIEGSQYVTNPLKLQFPLRGITYVELPSGVAWKGPNLSGSQGILIVHNSSVSARLENANSKEGVFRGLIIADYMFHVHSDVYGAIVLLSPKLEMFKECRGNEDHKVLFSADAIKRGTRILLKNGIGWKGRVPIIAWKE